MKNLKKILIVIYLLLCVSCFAQPTTEWIRQFNSGSNQDDYVADMKMDKLGNIYMCGYVRYDASNTDVLLLKYNSNGIFQWSRTFNGRQTNSLDEASKIIIDDSNNVYLLGNIQYNNLEDLLILKYNPQGDTIWKRSYDFESGTGDIARDFLIDINGNIYATCLIFTTGNTDMGTLAYDRNGNLKWVKLNSFGGPSAILSNSEYIYISCYLYSDTTFRNFTNILILDTLGNTLDTIRYDTGVKFGGGLMVFDSKKNFIKSGEYDAGLPEQTNIITTKITNAGAGQWISFYNNSSDHAPEYLYDLKVDRTDNIYTLIRSRNIQYKRSDISLIKYDNSTGDSIFTRRYTSVPFANNDPSEMTIDKFDAIYIIGKSDFNLINNRFVTLKYNSSGQLLWHAEYTPSVFVNSEGLRILKDTLNGLYVSGITGSSQNGNDIILIKYSDPVNIQNVSQSNPEKFDLYQNYPNPFNSQTEIKFEIIKNGRYKMEVFDMLGRNVMEIFNDDKIKGSYSIILNASDLSSGIYFYKLNSSEINLIKKFVLIK